MASTPTATNALKGLLGYGQSPWLDYIRRTLITSGELKRLIDEDGLRGVTSNPAIFEKAIAGSTDYTDVINDPTSASLNAKELYEKIAIRDVQDAADILLPVYQETKGGDGFVSLEVSPLLAHDTEGTLDEARRLWAAVGRKNLMVKVPATPEGIPAVRQLISEGININVTLIFSQAAYEQVAHAFIAGLEERAAKGGSVAGVASVASVFVSRIDASVDALLTAKIKDASGPAGDELKGLLGKVAIANAKLIYQKFLETFSGPHWDALQQQGAQPQRPLWASTSSKNPSYRDVIYVEELIGKATVNTIPPATFDAFRDHGQLRASLTENIEAAQHTMAALKESGISIDDVTDKLVADGVKQFADAFHGLLKATGKHQEAKAEPKINQLSYRLPEPLAAEVVAVLSDWASNDKANRLWKGDATLWTGADEAKWLGWLTITDTQVSTVQHLKDLASEVKSKGYKHALLMGMGGSSLCPEVMRLTFGKIEGFPELHVLDSTDPAQVAAIEHAIDIKSTLFIVSSKSGGTLEPNIFKQYFYERAKEALGAEEAGKRFIAITDPGSKVEKIASSEGFGHVFPGWPTIGGRYSALSNFGMVPAAVMGVDVVRLLGGAQEMVRACDATVPAKDNPGVLLGAVLGVAGNHGRDKVTIVASPGIHDLGAWLEQLIAESTGKVGKGLIPVDREELVKLELYGSDRVFVYLRLETAPDATQDQALVALEAAGQVVIRIAVKDIYSIAGEFFRWEFATAVAGSVLGINPFNQPDVEASKIATRKLTDEYEAKGHLPEETPFFDGEAVKLFADEKNATALKQSVGSGGSLSAYLKAHLNRLQAGDYFALLAYIQMNDEHESALQGMRSDVLHKKRVATCLGFGPRFLHSTGQAYKGGPNSGVFLQVTCDDAKDLAVPLQTYTFGTVKAAQARGDFAVLAERDRRALRVHLGADLAAGLRTLDAAIKLALA